jgi:cytochrome P450
VTRHRWLWFRDRLARSRRRVRAWVHSLRQMARRAVLAAAVPVVRWMLRSALCARVVPHLPERCQPGGRWVTRYDDVVDVLKRDRDFGMTYLKRMEQLGTPFILGMNPSGAYKRQSEALWEGFAEIDLDALSKVTRVLATEELATSAGEIDVVGRLTDRVLARTAPAVLWSGPALTEEQFADARAISRDIFINPFKDPKVRKRGEAATPRLRDYIEVIVADRGAAPQGGDVLGRLLAAGKLHGDELVDDLLGVTVAWVTSISRTMAYALDELLSGRRSDQLERAQSAAHYGDVATVGQIVFEALRFRPSMPALERVCTREARLGPRTIRRDRKLMLILTAAMVDKRGIPQAGKFYAGRPCDEYLHFGRDTHRCLGEAVARVQMSEIATALLRHPRARRASPLELDGPFPRHLFVSFDKIP